MNIAICTNQRLRSFYYLFFAPRSLYSVCHSVPLLFSRIHIHNINRIDPVVVVVVVGGGGGSSGSSSNSSCTTSHVLGANWGSTIGKDCRMALDRWNPENLGSGDQLGSARAVGYSSTEHVKGEIWCHKKRRNLIYDRKKKKGKTFISVE
jgi:hypothetical protein